MLCKVMSVQKHVQQKNGCEKRSIYRHFVISDFGGTALPSGGF